MPEHFTNLLGNWKSRAKELYRKTTYCRAHERFCKDLGHAPAEEVRRHRDASHVTHPPAAGASNTPNLQEALRRIHVGSLTGGDAPGLNIRRGVAVAECITPDRAGQYVMEWHGLGVG